MENNNGNAIDKIKKMGFTDNSAPSNNIDKAPKMSSVSSNLNKPVNKPTGTKTIQKNTIKVKSDYDDEDPNWKPENDAHYKSYDDEVKKANYSQKDIDSVINLGKEYSKGADRGIISFKQMDDIANKMGLSNLSDRDLRLAWDKYYNILQRESFKGGSMKRWKDFGDAASAFAEVINREARNRQENGNYFPYDENDINEAKNKIYDIAKSHEGYDLDNHKAYLNNEEGDKIREIANEYRLTDDDLADISPIFRGKMGYSGYGWKGK